MKLRLFAFSILVSLSFTYAGAQADTGWRGPGRTGIYNETGLLKEWPAAGPALIWESSDAGTGYSSVTAAADAVYITGRKNNHDVLTAYSPDGKKKWDVVYGKSSTSNYPDSRSTATVYKDKIFVVSGEGDMVCVGKEGKIKWSVNYFKKYGASEPRFGISESPVVVGNKVIGTPGGNMASMAAFDIETGTVVWTSEPVNELTQYVNPLLIEEKGKKLIVTVTIGHILGVDPDNGKLLWKVNYEAMNDVQGGRRNHTNTPVYRDGHLLVANGYNQAAVKLKINWDGSAPVVVWKNTDLTPHVGGAVLLGNYIYSSTHDNNTMGRWICVDWTTGKTMWMSSWHNKGSVISADGMLIIYEEKSGHVGLVRPNSRKLEVISEFQVNKGSGPFWAHPVIYMGRLFLRHGEYLAVYSLK